MDAQERYSRHLLLKGVGPKGQEALNNAKVLVIGAGGLGCPVMQYLAAAGVGTLGIVDGDVVSLSNLQRQILYKEAEIAKPKTTMAAAALRGLNSDIQIVEHNTFLNRENIRGIFSEYELIIDGSDNFSTRYMVNDACVLEDKPLVFGSISRFEGQISVFNFQGGPSYRCLFPEAPSEVGNCSTEGVLGVLPGIVGTQMAAEAIKIILGIGEPLNGKLKIINVLNNTELYVNVNRNQDNFKRTDLEADYSFECEDQLVRNITATELKTALETEELQLIDVREPHEFAQQRIEGSVNIPLGEIVDRKAEVKPHIKTVFICLSGVRSVKAIQQLENYQGLNLEGGLKAFFV